ncbi:MAG TPA: hypothetical protein VFH47_05910 [Candidatus Thermoplasmatota archaeon]|nr:hypothetical protein [Candidatus Thermoplasmatota archaeon]
MPTVLQPQSEAALMTYLSQLLPEDGVRARTLAHAWAAAGGTIHVGRHAIRLLGQAGGHTFTAATLHASAGPHGQPCLELCRVILEKHGVDADKWQEWADERPELRLHGFHDHAKYPVVRLGQLDDAALARLALGLRDLALWTKA